MTAWDFREPASAWTHAAGFALTIPAMVVLWRESRGDGIGRRVSALIYGLSLMLCYGASTLFHGVQVPPDRLGPYVRLDSVGIFALIAGSYTPVAWTLMSGPWRLWTLSTVWATAGSSILLILAGRHFSPVLGTVIYLVMGWGVVVCYARIARVVSHRALFPLVLGGIFYSVGAVFNIVHWPALWPGTFGTHDLFHLFVIAGSLTHFWFIARVALPYGRAEAPPYFAHDEDDPRPHPSEAGSLLPVGGRRVLEDAPRAGASPEGHQETSIPGASSRT